MRTVLALMNRNRKLFFKDKGMLFTSMITPVILIVLYATFLAKVFRDSFTAAIPDVITISDKLINGTVAAQLTASLMAVSCITVTFCVNLTMVQDKANGTRKDFDVSPVSSGKIYLGYFLSTVANSLMVNGLAFVLCLGYLLKMGWYMNAADVLWVLFDMILLVLFGSTLSSIISFPLTTQGQLSAVGTIVSAGYGFLCGAYMPISNFGLLGFLFPFIIGFGIAFILNIPMKFIEHHLFGKALKQEKKTAQKLARPVSLVLSICFVICIIVIVMLVVVPELGATFVNIAKKIEENIPVFQKWIDNVFGNNPEVVKWAQSLDIEPGKIIDSVLGVLKNGVNNIVSSTVSITMGLLTTAMNVSIGFVFACYVLLQKEKLLQQIKKAMYAMFPEKPVRYLAHVWNLANRIFSSFITGQCIEAVILGSMFFVSMTILHFPYAMLVGVLISFTALIPLFGGIIGCWVAFFLILMISPVKAVLFLGLFLILQQIEGNLIYPHVVGGSVGLPSIWVLVAVTLGGSLMGIAGMLIFIPTVSVIYTLFREWVYARLEKKQLVL